MKKIIAGLTLLLVISIGINGYMFVKNDEIKNEIRLTKIEKEKLIKEQVNKELIFNNNLKCQSQLNKIIIPEKDSAGHKIEISSIFFSPKYNNCLYTVESTFNDENATLRKKSLFKIGEKWYYQSSIDWCIEQYGITKNKYIIKQVEDNPCYEFNKKLKELGL